MKHKHEIDLSSAVSNGVLAAMTLTGLLPTEAVQKQLSLALISEAAHYLNEAKGDKAAARQLFTALLEGGTVQGSPTVADLAAKVAGGRVQRHEHVYIVVDEVPVPEKPADKTAS